MSSYCCLNVIGLYDLIGNDTIRRCGLVEVGMALLKKVCHYRGIVQAILSVTLSRLPVA